MGWFDFGISFNEETDIPALTGKVIFITGGTYYSNSYSDLFIQGSDMIAQATLD